MDNKAAPVTGRLFLWSLRPRKLLTCTLLRSRKNAPKRRAAEQRTASVRPVTTKKRNLEVTRAPRISGRKSERFCRRPGFPALHRAQGRFVSCNLCRKHLFPTRQVNNYEQPKTIHALTLDYRYCRNCRDGSLVFPRYSCG